MLKPIASTATTAIDAPTEKTPSDIFASRMRFWLAPALRICAAFAPCADWGLGNGLWLTRSPCRGIKRHPVATEHMVQTLSKIDHARISLTKQCHIKTNADAARSDSPDLIYLRRYLKFASATGCWRIIRQVSRSPVQVRSPFIVRAPFSDRPTLCVGSRIGTAAPILI